MLHTAVEPDTSVGSPIESGSRLGAAPKTPDSYTRSSCGATVRLARLQTMFGRPMPTKHTPPPASSRALATIIISDFDQRRSRSPVRLPPASSSFVVRVLPVVDLARRRVAGAKRVPPLGPQLLHIVLVGLQADHPFLQPRSQRLGAPRRRLPVELEPVVPVVVALGVARVAGERLLHHGVDDEPGNDGAVGIRTNDRLVHDLLTHHDDTLRREGGLLLASEQPPDLGVAAGVGPLRMDDRDVWVERGHGV